MGTQKKKENLGSNLIQNRDYGQILLANEYQVKLVSQRNYTKPQKSQNSNESAIWGCIENIHILT